MASFRSDKPGNREISKDLPPFLNRMWVNISFDSEFIAGRMGVFRCSTSGRTFCGGVL